MLNLFFPKFSIDSSGTSENLWFSDVFRGIKRELWRERVSVAWSTVRHLVLKFNITPERTGYNA